MYGHLLALSLAAALLAGVLTWAAALRYGRKLALMVPGMALLALVVMLWRAGMLTFHDGFGIAAAAVVFAAPALVGALLGIWIAGRRGR